MICTKAFLSVNYDMGRSRLQSNRNRIDHIRLKTMCHATYNFRGQPADSFNHVGDLSFIIVFFHHIGTNSAAFMDTKRLHDLQKRSPCIICSCLVYGNYKRLYHNTFKESTVVDSQNKIMLFTDKLNLASQNYLLDVFEWLCFALRRYRPIVSAFAEKVQFYMYNLRHFSYRHLHVSTEHYSLVITLAVFFSNDAI